VALQQVIDQAKKANVPKDIIERNLKRASEKDATNLTDEVLCSPAACTLMDISVTY
jgi:transcriptional/translational regulatory protein YebC/TACO1